MEVGTQVGAYRVVEQIGEGGMGSVWLAEHVMLGRRAAIKVLHAEYGSRQDIVTRFFNEARAATAIADPGIVQIFDFGNAADGSAYIVMELLDGEPLAKRRERLGRLPVPDALRIMRQVAASLGAAHARGIVHRDLKPENIYLVRDPEVAGGERAKILDFGIAKLANNAAGVKTNTAAVMGTPTYMSPEQCRGAGRVDQRSDVYALGCVLFTLVVGKPPFDGDGVGEIIAMHLREPAPRASAHASHVPPAVDELLARCLEKDPAKRFASGTELASAIDALGKLPATGSIEMLRPENADPSAPVMTTLGSASMQMAASSLPPKPRSRVGLIVGASAGALAIGGVAIALATSRGSGSADEPAASRRVGDETIRAVATPPHTPPPDAAAIAQAPPPPPIDAAVAAPPDPPPPASIDVTIASVPTGSQILLDGRPFGTTPFRGPLPRGDRELHFVVRHAGFYDWKLTESATGDVNRSVTLTALPTARPRDPKPNTGSNTGAGSAGTTPHHHDENEGINPLRP